MFCLYCEKRNSNKEIVPFLAVREEFHPRRNQARQKLATLPSSRFKDLASDVYHEIARRYNYVLESEVSSTTINWVSHLIDLICRVPIDLQYLQFRVSTNMNLHPPNPKLVSQQISYLLKEQSMSSRLCLLTRKKSTQQRGISLKIHR